MISLITFLFVFAFVIQTNCLTSLKCLGNQDATTGQLSSCSFTLKNGQSIRDDAQLMHAPLSCQMVTADANLQQNDDDGFCFVEVILNDNADEKVFSFSGEVKQSSKKQPYIGMMGAALTKSETIQYATYLNFEQDQLELVLRVQCRTEDNCAWKIVKTILNTMSDLNARWAIFQYLKQMIVVTKPNPTQPLACATSGLGNPVVCGPNEKQCYVSISDLHLISMGCIDPNNLTDSQLELQQNYLKPIELNTYQQSPTLRKFKFACRWNSCNSIVIQPAFNTVLLLFFLPAQASNNPNGLIKPNANAAMMFSPDVFSILSTIIFIKMKN